MKLRRLGRNLAGLGLIVVGLILWLTPILPGGVLALIGLALIDFPGKRRLLMRLMRTKLVARLMEGNPELAKLWKRLYRRSLIDKRSSSGI